MPAYLDHAASSPLRPEAFAAMQAVLTGGHGNPSGAHRSAREARRLIDEAREVVAAAVGAHPTEVVFTSGGTEADNLAVLGTLDRSDGVAVCSAIEHHAVLDPVLGRGGVAAPVTPAGVVDLEALDALLAGLTGSAGGPVAPVALVSVMAVNNEVGTIQPIVEVVEVVRRRAPEALVHCDAVQAASWLDLASVTAGCDLVSISAHKFGGPQGVGALVVRGEAAGRLAARQVGGAQERELRPGTQNVAGIVGLGAALAVTLERRAEEVDRIAALRDRLSAGLVAQVPGLVLTAVAGDAAPPDDAGRPGDRLDPDRVAAGICHVCIDGIENEPLLYLLDDEGVDASAASSCASGALVTSHVLDAMGVASQQAAGSLRLSLGWSSTDADVDVALTVIPAAVARLARYAEAT